MNESKHCFIEQSVAIPYWVVWADNRIDMIAEYRSRSAAVRGARRKGYEIDGVVSLKDIDVF